MNIDWEWQELNKDRDCSTIADNYWKNFNRLIPVAESSDNSYFCREWLINRIEKIEPPEDYFALSDYIERLPSFDEIRSIAEDVAIFLGLVIEVEKFSADNSGKLDLLFSWY